jgi:hypothetical protein
MSVLPTPKHTARVEEARELGAMAGREYQHVAGQTCDPADWTEEAREKWCRLLAYIRENPYEDGGFPYADATDEQNRLYANNWEISFRQSRHAAQAEQRRKEAVQ